MASVSTSHLILFIASMLVAASVSGAFINGIERLSGALGDQSVDVSSNVRTDIEIISDPAAGNVYNVSEENVTVLVKNTGSKSLAATTDELDVLVDGAYQTDLTVTVVGGGNRWGSGDVVRVVINESLASGDHRVLVIANGDEELLEFRTS